jgi:hypothetical protein
LRIHLRQDRIGACNGELYMTAELGALAVSLILIAALIYSIKLYMEV